MKTILKIMLWSAIALIIPLLGQLFVDGWNWTWNDFVFAWVFFVVMALAIRFAVRLVSGTARILIGILVFLVFAAVWVTLATG